MANHFTRNCTTLPLCLLILIVSTGAALAEGSDFLLGGDISALARIEQAQGVYRDDGKVNDAITILSRNGANCFRLRLFVDPNHENLVVNDLEYTLAVAKRAKQAGRLLLLDFHYSDTWADPGKQYTPASWTELSFDELEAKVSEYTADVISRFRDEGVLPDIVQVGNEVINGMLWPHGKIVYDGSDDEKRESWTRFCRLLKSGIAGVKVALQPGDDVRIMIHIDRGGNWMGTKYFFDNLLRDLVEFDIIGQSFYPWWHGTIDDLKHCLGETAKRYQKPIMVVETGYPHRGRDWMTRPNMAWPISPAGQEQFLQDVIALTRELPDNLGIGVMYWYPEAIPVRGLHIWEGGSVGLFDEAGNSLPAIKSFLSRVPVTSRLEGGETR